VIDPSDGLCILKRINLILPMKNPYATSKNASLAELRAAAFAAFDDHKKDMKTDADYKKAHVMNLARIRHNDKVNVK
jgi:hypothetical protein